MPKGIRYTEEFKREAVAQVIDRGYSIGDVADRLGITTKSLYTWKAKTALHRPNLGRVIKKWRFGYFH